MQHNTGVVKLENDDSAWWIAVQLCDASFPSGGLANSHGLESALHHGFVRMQDMESLEMYLKLALFQVIAKLFSDYYNAMSTLHC